MDKQKTEHSNDWNRFNQFFKRREVPAKTILLQEGEISRTMFFVEKGCLRTWINNDGREITTQFFFENDKVSSIESFRTNKPSLYSIESLEPCILQTISQQDFQNVLENLPEIKEVMQEHLFRRLLQSQKTFYSYLKNTPQQRYHELIEEYPHIIQRIPQHYIASYLGITAVSLSRIRNRR
ncbi:MAG: Crp/Fnr family transcriptional regulator [Chryseobacterium sp.]|nr:MAG: Crp/Fnr family transcriptional regulator [Chryseobacterium sp.]